MATNLADLLDDDDAFLDAIGEGTTESSDAAAPDPSPADPEPDSDPSADATDGPPRDAHGRFAPKAPADATPGADPSALPASDALTAPPADAPAPPATPAGQPFVIKADGRELPLEGAQVIPGQGLVIPEAQLARASQLLSRGVHHETTWRQTQMEAQRTIRDLTQQLHAKSERDSLADRLFEAIERLPEDQMLTAILEFREALPQQRVQWMQAELDALRSGKAPAHGTMPSLPDDGPPDPETVSQTLAATLQQYETVPGAQLLTPDDWQAIRALGDGFGGALVKRAETDLPDDGVLAGQWYFDAAPVGRLVADRIAIRQQQQQAADAMARAAKANAAQVTPSKAPPAAGTKATTVAPAEKMDVRDFASFRKSFLKDE